MNAISNPVLGIFVYIQYLNFLKSLFSYCSCRPYDTLEVRVYNMEGTVAPSFYAKTIMKTSLLIQIKAFLTFLSMALKVKKRSGKKQVSSILKNNENRGRVTLNNLAPFSNSGIHSDLR